MAQIVADHESGLRRASRCGAGPACHGHVIVTHDAIGLSLRKPKFVPQLNDLAGPMKQAFAQYVQDVQSGKYPAAEHEYEMAADEKQKFNG
jgi:3-methyl-2-oxobutanoate hydroxymethyltransferase